MTPLWYERAAEQLEKSIDNGELSEKEYREEMRGLQQELEEEANAVRSDYIGY